MDKSQQTKMEDQVISYTVVVRTNDGDNITVGQFTNELEAVLKKACYKDAFIIATLSSGELKIL
jgi:hypothetical protein